MDFPFAYKSSGNGYVYIIKTIILIADKKYMFWKIVLTAITGSFLFSLDGSIVNIALPSIADSYNATVSDIAFIPTAYMITVSSTLLLVSMFFTRFGIKKVLTAGYLLFFLSTILCSFAPDLRIMIILRIFQGLGGSVLLNGAFTLIPRYIDKNKMGLGLGFVSSSLAVGIAAGYPLGGYITDHLGWRYIFIFVTGLTLIPFTYILRSLPDDEPADRNAGFDIRGVMLFFIAFSLFTYFLQYVEYSGLKNIKVTLSLFGFFIVSAIFLYVEKRNSNPVVDISLFKSRDYGFAMCARLFVGMLQYGNLFMMPFFLGIIKKMSPSESGLLIATYSIFYILIAPVSGLFTDRFSPQRISLLSIIVLMFASLLFPLIMGIKGPALIVAYMIIISIGFSFFYPANNKFCITAVPANRQSMSVGIFLTIWVIGMSLGVSFFEMVFSMSLLGHDEGLSALKELVVKIPEGMLFDAFRNVYTAGFIIILSALVFLMISLGRQPLEKERSL
ncbi:MAG TPA: MFS transporter [Desulfomonilia bacterium]